MRTPTPDAGAASAALTELEKDILTFESQWWLHEGIRMAATAVHAMFGLRLNDYFALLKGLVERPEAMEFAPLTVHRLRRTLVRDACNARHPAHHFET